MFKLISKLRNTVLQVSPCPEMYRDYEEVEKNVCVCVCGGWGGGGGGGGKNVELPLEFKV